MRVDATHADDEMPSGLVRRNGRYSLRRRVPLDLVEAFGRQEITKALGTADRTEAKKRLAVEMVRLDQDFDAKRAEIQNPDRPDEPQRQTGRFGDRAARSGGGFPAVFAAMKSVLDASFPESGDEPSVQRRSAPQRARPGIKSASWDRLIDQWATERTVTDKTRRAHRQVVTAFIGANPQVLPATVHKDHVIAYKDYLFKGDGEKRKPATPANVRTKLSRLKTLINFGVVNGLVPPQEADGIRIAKPKEAGRISYDDQSLAKLFCGPVHQSGLRPTHGRGEASYWLPLIALYSGARLEEIAGLRAADLVELEVVEGANTRRGWFFRFTPNADDNRQLKTAGSERETPVHPELIRLGLIRYAAGVTEAGHQQLFPMLKAHADGKRAHKWGSWFTAYRRVTCGVVNDRIDFHSFRHTFKDAAREAEMPEGLQRQIMGHLGKDVASGYGLGYSKRLALDHIANVRYPALPRIAPFDAGD